MYFTISLNMPQPPLYPSIWLFVPHVISHWVLRMAERISGLLDELKGTKLVETGAGTAVVLLWL
jgi:hypothetical protein